MRLLGHLASHRSALIRDRARLRLTCRNATAHTHVNRGRATRWRQRASLPPWVALQRSRIACAAPATASLSPLTDDDLADPSSITCGTRARYQHRPRAAAHDTTVPREPAAVDPAHSERPRIACDRRLVSGTNRAPAPESARATRMHRLDSDSAPGNRCESVRSHWARRSSSACWTASGICGTSERSRE